MNPIQPSMAAQRYPTSLDSVTLPAEEFERLLEKGGPYPSQNIVVTGNVEVGNLNSVTLPKGLRVEGNLELRRCSGLISLPEGLSVEGRLYLFVCTGLKALPAGLRVGGDLKLEGCKGLTDLPEGLSVGKNLDLWVCEGLKALPAGLRVGGNLDLKGCTGLTALPEGLSIGGNLSIPRNLIKIKALPEGLSVGGRLDICDWKKLKALPKGLRVGTLVLRSEAIKLKQVQEGIRLSPSIRYLRLKGDPTPECLEAVAGCIRESRIRVLDLTKYMPEKAKMTLLHALRTNTSISEVYFSGGF